LPPFREACFIRSNDSRICRKHTMMSWPKCAQPTRLLTRQRLTVRANAESAYGRTGTELRSALVRP